MANPFQIDVLGGQGPALSRGLMGLGSILQENREKKAANVRAEEMKEAFTLALQSKDPEKMMLASFKYPEGQKQMEKAFDFYTDRQGNQPTKDVVGNIYRRVMADPKNAQEIIGAGIEEVKALGGSPNILTKNFQGFANNPDAELRNIEMAYAGMAPKEYEAFKKLGAGENLTKIREETRSSIRKEFKLISTAADVLVDNFTKLKNLTVEMKKGNRTAVAQGIVSLVKLNDPNSAVLDSEAKAALNTVTPIASIAKYLSSKGTSDDVIQSILTKVDVLSPDNIKEEDLIATAKAMISANIPTIQSNFSSQQELGIGSLTEAGYKSILPPKLQSKIESLNDLVAGGGDTGITGAKITEGMTATGPDGSKIKFINNEWVKI